MVACCPPQPGSIRHKPACFPAQHPQERYQGILQAIDSLGAEVSVHSMRSMDDTSASEDAGEEGQMSPEAARLTRASDTGVGREVGARVARAQCLHPPGAREALSAALHAPAPFCAYGRRQHCNCCFPAPLQEGKAAEAAARFERLRQTVDELGEGEEAAELIRQSYQGVSLPCLLA